MEIKCTSSTITGIYKITNIVTNRVYIGQSINILDRLIHHKLELNRNKHQCKQLQLDYNLYGKSKFIGEIVEEYNKLDMLHTKEEYYINKYINSGYSVYNRNLHPHANYRRFSKTPYNIVDLHTGEKFKGNNVAELARKLNLDPTHIFKLMSGHLNLIGKRYVLEKNYYKYPEYKLVSPDNEVITTRALSYICLKYNIDNNKFNEILDGKRYSAKGWTFLQNIKDPIKLISPENEVFKVDNIYSFAYNHKLKPSLLLNVVKGTKSVYNGWRIST